MTERHGVFITESATSVLPPVTSSAGLPVVVGTAPIHLAKDQTYVNKPYLAYTYEEAAAALGYSDDWESFTLCEVMRSQFQLFQAAPVVFINVLDPAKHKKSVAEAQVSMTDGKAALEQTGVLLDSLVVRLASGQDPLVKGTDYTAAFDSDGRVVITPIPGGAISQGQATLVVSYDYLDPSMVTKDDVIGGVDATTGAYTGLELVNKVFPLFRLVPGLILAPGWSQDPTVAAVMKVKASSINGLFKALAVLDADSSAVPLYSNVPGWKEQHNYVDPLEVVCWPKVKLGDDVYHLSTQFAGVVGALDAQNDDIPYVSPSNRSLQADSSVTADGTEVNLGPEQASYLNSEGIVTALNFIGGWRLWGNRTAAYPTNTDVKDSFIPVRRMFNWVANSIILSYWQMVDDPANRRLIDTLVDSVNIWLNGLTARGALLGGRLEFRKADNPTTDLLNGVVRFHVFLAHPVPAQEIDFTLEFDVSYLNALFAA